ncbi:hypothetical protein [Streptomyces luteogriseus]|uniref:Uncharacterized protein n=1 Tax=Streptomyces luteogriseus TaxID=68233 RepID=A0A7W7GE09_9ACTN|nr:hypothetical protein [Streptomyces luteogriseus]MBB4711692.1 hypothetical protein [Streptomyces luteogriseus]
MLGGAAPWRGPENFGCFKRVGGKYQVKLKNVGPWKYARYRTLG